MKFHSLFKSSEKFIEDNAPTILTGAAVIGTVATGYLAVRGTSRAIATIEEKETNGGLKWSEMSKPVLTASRAKLVWPHYISAIGAGSATIACVICAHRISASRIAAMAAAYSLSESKFKEYKDKISEKFGLEKAAEVHKEVAEEKAVRVQRSTDAIILGTEEVLCFDSYSGRYFKSSTEAIRSAVNDTNFEVVHNNYATLQFFWEIIGLDATAFSEEWGWTADCPLEIKFSTMMSSEDKPCLLIDYDVEPIRRWNHIGP